MIQIYLYNNSPAQGKQGFIVSKAKGKHKINTTVEFAFAKEFGTHQEACKWRDKYELVAIVFLRVADEIYK